MSITRSSPVQVAAYSTTYSQAPKLVSTSWSKVSIGPSHVLAIKSNNTLWAWGINTNGQLGDGTTISRSSPVQLGNPSYTWNDVSAGINYSVGLRGDGLLFTWGLNTTGVLGDLNAGTTNRSSPIQVGTSSWIAVSAGGSHVVAIRSDKSLWGWGLNNVGQLGIGDFATRSSPVQVSSSSWSIVSAGQTHTTAITTDGKLYTWGDNTAGTLGYDTPAQRYFSWTVVSSGTDNTIAIRNDGLLFAWGSNQAGQLGDGTTIARSSPVQIGTNSWVALASVWSTTPGYTMAIRSDGTLWGWGLNTSGQIGDGTIISRSSPVQVSGGGSWTNVAISNFHTLAVKSNDGLLYAWGLNTSGQLGVNDLVSRSSPVQVSSIVTASLLTFNGATAVDTSGNNVTLTVASGAPTLGNAVIPFSNTYSANFTSNAYYQASIPALGTQWTFEFWVYVTTVPPGTWYWLTTGGGLPMFTMTGNSTSITAVGKVNPGGAGNVNGAVSLAVNTWAHIAYTRNSANLITVWFNGTSVATLTDSTSYTGNAAQIGYPSGGNGGSAAGYLSNFRFINNYSAYTTAFTRPTTASPASISIYGTTTPVNRITAISASDTSSYVIKSDNQLYAWGAGTDGRLGFGDTLSRSSPTQLGSNSWVSVFAYGSPTFVHAIDSRNKLFGWGAGTAGQLGYNDIVSRSSPVQISSGNWSVASAYGTGVLGLQTDGSLWAWGAKTVGLLSEFGNANFTYSWSQVSAGPSHSAAVRSDGRLYTWGLNSSGQLGNSATVNTSSPVLITTISSGDRPYEFWNRVSVNGSRTVAVRSDGTLWTWGSNAGYLLGTGDSVNRSRPVQIANSITTEVSNSNIWSTYFNGASDYITFPDNAALELGANNFTIECWVYSISSATQQTIVNKTATGSVVGSYDLRINTNGTIQYFASNTSGATWTINAATTGTVNFNNWNHVAYVRNTGGVFTVYINGISAGTTTNNITLVNEATTTNIGATGDGVSTRFTGYITNLRITTGQALYTDTFTPSTAPLTTSSVGSTGSGAAASLTGTVALLTCQNFSVVDNSSNGFVATKFGELNPGQPTTPFTSYISATRSWTGVSAGLSHTVAVNSLGRMYAWGDNTYTQLGYTNANSYSTLFSGSSYITIASNALFTIGASDFTFETWIYPTSYPGSQALLLSAWNNGNGWQILMGSTGKIIWQIGGSDNNNANNTATVSLNVWTHVTWTRTGGFCYTFINGVLVTAVANTSNNTSNGTITIGSQGASLYFTGYMSNMRFIKGTGLYSTSFVPSSTPLSAVANTSLLALQNTTLIDNSGNNLTLTATGTVTAGQALNPFGYYPAQIGTSSWSQVSSYGTHSLGIDVNNKLYGWGDNTVGQIGIGASPYFWSSVYVNKGAGGSFAKRNDGTLWSWGVNASGQLGTSNTVDRSSPVQIGTSSWSMVAVGFSHTIAIKGDGTLWSWGDNAQGQLGQNTTTATASNRSSPVQIGTSSWSYVASNGSTSFAIDILGRLFAWGQSTVYGVLGLNDTNNRSSPTQVGSNSWTSVDTGAYSGLPVGIAVRSDGALFTWGAGTAGQLGLGDTLHRSSPVQVGTSSWLVVGGAAQNATFAIRSDNTLWGWGSNLYGYLGDSTTVNKSSPIQINTGYNISQVSVQEGAMFARRTDGILIGWGYNANGELGQSDTVNRSSPVQIGTSSWNFIAAGTGILGITYGNTGLPQLYGWGQSVGNGLSSARSSPVQINAGSLTQSISSPTQIGTSSWTAISAGLSNSMAIRSDYKLFSWGDNSQLQSGYITPATALGTGSNQNNNGQSYIRNTDNALILWGRNQDGELGLGDTLHRSSPVQLSAGLGGVQFKKISKTKSAISNYTVAIRTDGSLWSWGYNNYGQLGSSNTVTRSSPVQVGTLTNWSDIATGVSHTLALKSDGSLWGWGFNTSGQAGLLSWAKVSSGSSHTLALRSDGQMYGWGSNTVGQVGDISILNRSSPVQIGTGFSWNNVAAGINISAAVRGDNLLFTWGNNANGSLGQNDVANRSSPTQVGTSLWNQVSARDYMAGIDRSGSLYAWGTNTNGQLGDNTTVNRSSPVQVVSDNSGMYLNATTSGTAPFFYTNSNANLNLSGSWTIEFFIKWTGAQYNTGVNGRDTVVGSYNAAGGQTWGIDTNGNSGYYGGLTFWADPSPYNGGTAYNSTLNIPGTLKTNTWLHIALTCNVTTNTVFTFYIDGRSVGSSTYATTNAQSTATQWVINQTVNGSVTNIRFTKSLLYTTDFNVPTNYYTPFSVLANTQLLVNPNSTLTALQDSSANGVTINYSAGSVNNISIIRTAIPNYVSFTVVSTGTATAAINLAGNLLTWGLNTSGQLGDNTIVSRSSPVQVGTISSTSSWSAVSSSNSAHMLAVTVDGKLYSWGNNLFSQLGINDAFNRSSPVQVSAGTSYTNVYAGTNYSLALKNDSTLWGWGDGTRGTIPVVNPLSWINLSSSTGIHDDYTLWVWGDNAAGQLGISSTQYRSSPVQIGTTSWTSTSKGISNTFAIKSDGSLWSWGLNSNGELGLNDTVNRSSPVQIGSSSWTRISTGSAGHTLAITTTGSLFGWGLNNAGQLGDGTSINRSSPVQVGTSSWTQVSAGFSFSTAIRTDGGLFTWGFGTQGQLGSGLTTARSSPVQVGTSSWSQVSAGDSHTMALRYLDGGLFTWGFGTQGQLGSNATVARSSPVQVGTSSWSQISAGISTGAAITILGGLFTWGLGSSGQLGSAATTSRSAPVQLGVSSWSSVSAGKDMMFAYDITNRLFAWGTNALGQLGLNDVALRSSPVQVGTTIQTLYSNPTQIGGSAVSTNSSVFFNSANNDYLIVNNSSAFNIASNSSNYTIEAWVYTTTTGAIRTIVAKDWVGSNYPSWGFSLTASGTIEFDIGSGTTSSAGYQLISGTKTVDVNAWTHVAVVITGNTSCKMYVNGTLDVTTAITGTQGLGSNNILIGQNGQSVQFFNGYISNLRITKSLVYTSNFIPSRSPLTTSSQGVSSANVGLLTLQNSTLIDNSPNGYTLQPLGSPLLTDTSYTQVSAGESNFAVVGLIGTLFISGDNTTGQLGNNTTVARTIPLPIAYPTLYDNRSSPAQIGTGSWSQIAAGLNYSLAIKSDGTLYTWGDNTSGYLGDGTTYIRRSMAQVGTNSYTSISAGITHNVALRTNNTLYAWGINSNGQLGDNTLIPRSSPVQVNTGLVTSWNSVSAGGTHTVAIDATYNRPYAWGYNAYGQLGDSTLLDKSAPVQVTTAASQNYSYQFNGTTQYLSVASNAALTFGTGDFTIEFWFNGASQLDKFFYDNRGAVNATYPHITTGASTSTLRWGPTNLTGSIIIGNSTWHHCAVTRQSGTIKLWVDGVLDTSGSDTTNYSTNYPVYIGSNCYVPPANLISGYISNLRVIKGTALYTAGFYPSTGALTTSSQGATASQVSLLTAQSATIVDNSINVFAITNIGTVAAASTNPFGPYYSGSFNGTNQYLSITDNSALSQWWTQDYTIELWIYNRQNKVSGVNQAPLQVVYGVPASDTTNWAFGTNASGNLLFYYYNGAVITNAVSTSTVSLNTWTHIAMAYTNSNTTITGYINGVQAFSVAKSGTPTSIASTINIGVAQNTYYNGYISNLRIVNGTAVYTGSFTPPTNILRTTQSAMTNMVALTGTETKLLTLQNATIVDNSTNAFTITNNNTVTTTTAYAPFSASTAGVNTTWDVVQTGNLMSMGISNNTLYTWGFNNAGQLAIPVLASYSTPQNVGSVWSVAEKLFSSPVQVGTAKSWSIVSTGGAHTIASATDYSIWSWGQGAAGQMGDGTTSGKSSPTQIAGNTNSYTFITAGLSNTFVIRSTSALLFAWGLGSAGQIGDNTVITRSSPVQIFAGTMTSPLIPIRLNTVSGSSYTQVQSGNAYNIIDNAGRLFTWGTNVNGQTGNNTTVSRSSPIQLGGLQLSYINSPVQVGSSSYSQISAGYSHTLAIDTNSLLYAWGKTPANGQSVNRSSPVQIGSNSWLNVSTGNDLSLATDITQTLYAWGLNTNYQLGSPSFYLNQSVTSPVAIGTLALRQGEASSGGAGNGGFIKNI